MEIVLLLSMKIQKHHRKFGPKLKHFAGLPGFQNDMLSLVQKGPTRTARITKEPLERLP